MKIEKNSLIIAYIGFLIISGIVYIASVVAHFEFESWKRIIAAATIASYWFSIAGVSKTTITVSNRIISDCKNFHLICLEQKNKYRSVMPELISQNALNVHAEEIEEVLTSLSKEIQGLIDSNELKIKKSGKWVFIFNVIGYLLFFCIAMFEPFYNKICYSQEFLTLLAFIIILVCDYIADFYSNKFSESIKYLYINVEKNLTILKEIYEKLEINL